MEKSKKKIIKILKKLEKKERIELSDQLRVEKSGKGTRTILSDFPVYGFEESIHANAPD